MNHCYLLPFLFEVLQVCCWALMNDPMKASIARCPLLREQGFQKCKSLMIRAIADHWQWLQSKINCCAYPVDRQRLIQETVRSVWIDWYASCARAIPLKVEYLLTKGVARYLLRNGSLLSIEVEPKLIDGLVLEALVANISTLLFRRVLSVDCSRVGMCLNRLRIKVVR